MYGLVSRPRAAGSAFHNVDLEDADLAKRMEGFEEWSREFALGPQAGPSPIAKLELLRLPPISPPSDATVFPDEPAALSLSPPPPTFSSVPGAATTTKRPVSLSPTPTDAGPSAPKRPRMRTPQPPTPPPEIPPESMNTSQLLPPLRRSYSPVLRAEAPEWIPLDNYRPAASPPHTPPSIPMPLTSAYTANLPPLPPVPASQPKARHKKKDDKVGITKLYTQFAVNPLSDAMGNSTKCVLTSDWRIAMQELRHIRAMERIEAKKAEARWSLRQPKKAKGVPVPKAHWDYLLEEMVS